MSYIQVVDWFAFYKPNRPFAIDMAGFAVNLNLFFEHPNAWFKYNVEEGYQESTILQGLGVQLSDLEPKADGCTKVRLGMYVHVIKSITMFYPIMVLSIQVN